IRSAFIASGLQLPRKRIALNLAPADLPKTDSSFDLAMAVAILFASKQIPESAVGLSAVIGELGFDGRLRPARGIIGKLLTARRLGVTQCIIPAANAPQAVLVPGVTIRPVTDIKQLYDYLATGIGLDAVETGEGQLPTVAAIGDGYSDEVIGQEQ